MAGSQLWKDFWWLAIILILGVLIVCLLSWAWVFLWRWGNHNLLLGFTAPVNDSIWELTKIFWFPFLLFFIVLYASAYHALRNPAVALLCASLAAVLFFWLLFYLYTWFNPVRNNFGANVTLWILAIIIAMVVLFFCLTAPYLGDGANYACIAIYLVIVILFCVMTYMPPVNGGMWWHKECGEGFGGGGGTGGLIPPPCSKAKDQATNFDDPKATIDVGKLKDKKKEKMKEKEKEECDGYHSDDHKKGKGKKKHHKGYDSDTSSL